jgi:hypothetical protein
MDIVWIFNFNFNFNFGTNGGKLHCERGIVWILRCCANKEFQCVQHIPRLDCRLNRKNKYYCCPSWLLLNRIPGFQ